MSDQKLMIILGCAALVFIILTVILGMMMKKRNQAKVIKQLDMGKKKNAKNTLYGLYKVYMATPILRRYYVKLKNNYRAILPADEVTLNKKTTNRMTLSLGICSLIMIVVLLVSINDFAYVLVGFLACYIIFTNIINTSEQRLQMKILDQLDTLISDVSAYYEDCKMVDEALSTAQDDLPYEIGLHANIIHDIVTSTDIELEIEKYIDVAPNKFLLLFATICTTIQEHGDKILSNGRSMFIQNLEYLKTELGNERLRLAKRTIAFQGKIFAVLIPLFCLKPLEIWAMSNMPEISSFYKGSGGIISLIIVMIVTYICYEYINILKDDHSEEGKSDKFYKRIANIPMIRKYITTWINKNYTKSKRMTDKLKSVGDKSTIDVFIVKQFCVSIAFFVLFTGISMVAVHKEKSLILKDFQDAYASSLVPDEEYRDNMRDMSSMYQWEIKHGYTDEEFLQVIGGDLDPAYAELMATELSKRAAEYHTHYYKWWMLLLSMAVSVFGFFVPNWLLNFKVKIMGMAREEEVSQFRTLILILMHEDGMTLDKILEWMERFAHSFKASITDCILDLEHDEQQAILDMRDKESGFAPFRRLCDSFLSVDKVGLEAAFASLEVDKIYYQQKRKDDNEALLRKCTAKAERAQFLPIIAVILLYLIVPIAIYAMNMYNELNFTF